MYHDENQSQTRGRDAQFKQRTLYHFTKYKTRVSAQ